MALFTRIASVLAEVGDDKFWKSFFYYFELRLPANAVAGVGGGPFQTSFYFPLVLNPQAVQVGDVFTVTMTPTNEGGLFIERNGVLMRPIHIDGTFGFSPKTYKAGTPFMVKTSRSSYDPRYVLGAELVGVLSSQKHFQFLQDHVFRAYGDLVRDPTTAQQTTLLFHNVKDDQHWIVEPQQFMESRQWQRPVEYPYAIDLIAVDKAAVDPEGGFGSTEDTGPGGWLDDVKDAVRSVRDAFDDARSAINDLEKYVDDVAHTISGALLIVDDAIGLLNHVADFLVGVSDAIGLPLRMAASIVGRIDDIKDRFDDLPSEIASPTAHSFGLLQDAVRRLMTSADAFSSQATGSRAVRAGAAAQALTAGDPPTTGRGVAALGTAPSPGDPLRFQNAPGSPVSPSISSRAVVLADSDTLASLAARYLGDASAWRLIADLNGLSPPYISAHGQPGTLGPGDAILVPSFEPGPTTEPLLATLGTRPTDPLEVRLLGTDFRVEADRSGQFDFQLDIASGKTDFEAVAGVANLAQGMRTRLMTEQGTAPLYRRLGYRRTIALGQPQLDAEVTRYALREAIAVDPRLGSVPALTLAPTGADIVDAEITAIVRGFHNPVRTRFQVVG